MLLDYIGTIYGLSELKKSWIKNLRSPKSGLKTIFEKPLKYFMHAIFTTLNIACILDCFKIFDGIRQRYTQYRPTQARKRTELRQSDCSSHPWISDTARSNKNERYETKLWSHITSFNCSMHDNIYIEKTNRIASNFLFVKATPTFPPFFVTVTYCQNYFLIWWRSLRLKMSLEMISKVQFTR